MYKNLHIAILTISILFGISGNSAWGKGGKVFSSSADIFQTSYFIENKGQFNSFGNTENPVRYALENGNDKVYFNSTGFVYHLIKTEEDKVRKETTGKKDTERKKEEEEEEDKKITTEDVTLKWLGANPHPVIEQYERSGHYFTYGSKEFLSYGYKKILYKELYPGIDVEFTIPDKGGIKYSVIVHPGADIQQFRFSYKGKKVKPLLESENLLIKNPVIDLSEKELKAYDEDGRTVHCSFVLEKDIVRFKMGEEYDKTKKLIIDPWVAPITTLTVVNGLANNMGFDVDYDYEGNLYVYGGGYFTYSGGEENEKVAKYSTTGVLLWTFSGSLPAVPWESSTSYGLMSNFILDKLNDKIYVGQGYNSGGTRIVRLDKNGIYDGFVSTANGNFLEVWDFAFNCNTGYIFGMGGGISSNINMGAINPGNGNFTLYNYTGLGGFGQDIVSVAIDNNGALYTLMSSLVGTPAVDNHIYKLNATFNGFVWQVPSGYLSMVEADNKIFVTSGASNGLNALSVNTQYLFYYDGYNLKAFNSATGAAVGTATTINTQSVKMQGGIYADDCNNIYLGGANGKIKVFTFNGSTFTADPDITLPGFTGHIYDIKFNPGNNLLYVSGEGYVGTVAPSFLCTDTSTLNISLTTICYDQASVSITNPAGTAQYTYTWTDSASNTILRTLTTTATSDAISGLNQGQAYTITVIKNQLCGGKLISKNFTLTCTTNTTDLFINICNGKSYTNNGITYTTAGIFRDTLTDIAGLDSILIIHISVLSNTAATQNISLCSGQTFTVGTHTYSVNGTYSDTILNSAGCDSIITTNLTVHPTASKTQNISICNGSSYSIGTHTYTTPGTYKDTLKTTFNCDSIVTTVLAVNPTASKTQNISICNGKSYSIGTHTYTSAGTYKDTLKTTFNCDSIITTVLTVNPTPSKTQNISICNGKSYSIGTHTYTSAGTYKDTLKTTFNCDSIITTVLTVNPTPSKTQNISICNGKSYSIGTHTYTSAGTYKDTLKTTFNCDSIITTVLTVNPTPSKTQNISICNGKSYSIGTHTYTTAGTYKDTLKTTFNCDSIITTVLTVNPTPSKTQNISICNGKTYSIGTHTYTTAGTYKDTLKTTFNCDSIITTNLTILPTPSKTQNISICNGKSYSIGTHTYTTAGTYKDTLKTTFNCDSIITTVLTVNPTPSKTQNISICNGKSYSIGTHTYTTAGTYKDTLKTTFNCDSIITTILTILPTPSKTQNISICNGGSYIIGTHTYVTAGTYHDTLISSLGCDSMVTTTLVVHTTPKITQNFSLCPGRSVKVGTHTYTLAGTYQDTLRTIFNCDSIITTNITAAFDIQVNKNFNICEGQSVAVYQHTYNTTGIYKDTVKALPGCDTVITTNLIVTKYPTQNLGGDQAICPGTSALLDAGNPGSTYQWNTGDTTQTISVNTSGTYSVLVSRNNCATPDSIVIVVKPRLTLNLGNDTSLCYKDSLLLDASTPNGTYLWQDGSTRPSLLVLKDGIYSVLVRNECDSLRDEIQVTYIECECEYYIPNAFTPNSDGVNDGFGVVNDCQSVENFKFEIYNRWGELVFKTENPAEKWDGNFKNALSHVDDYIYILSYRSHQKDYYKKGTVSLVR